MKVIFWVDGYEPNNVVKELETEIEPKVNQTWYLFENDDRKFTVKRVFIQVVKGQIDHIIAECIQE